MDWKSWSQAWSKEYDDNEQKTSETKTEEFALKTNVLAFASRPKAKARPRRPTSACSSSRTVPICERRWTDIEPGTRSSSKKTACSSSSWTINSRRRWSDRFWRLKDDFRICQKPSPPRVRWASWRAYFYRTILEVASFFKHIVVEQELEMSS